MTTTYQSAHLGSVSSTFDPSQSWILTSTTKPFPTAAATTQLLPTATPSTTIASSFTTTTPASLSNLNVPSQPQPSQPLPVRFQQSNTTTSESVAFVPKPPHPLYSTESSHYGARNPESGEQPNVYFGHQLSFSAEFGGGMYSQSGLDTGVRKSRVVNGKEELGW